MFREMPSPAMENEANDQEVRENLTIKKDTVEEKPIDKEAIRKANEKYNDAIAKIRGELNG